MTLPCGLLAFISLIILPEMAATQTYTKTEKLVWKGIYYNTSEFVTVTAGEFYQVKGFITGEADGKPLHVSYNLTIDSHWNIKQVKIEATTDIIRQIILQKDVNNHWLNDKGE